jgi:hypothetical protein
MSTTNTYDISSDKWPALFNVLSRQYEGWAATIEVLQGELGDQQAADGLPLQGLSFERAGSQAGDILIEVGDAGTPFETHLIHRPRAVRVAVMRPGAEADIQFETDEGVTTLLRLRRRPELPDRPTDPVN